MMACTYETGVHDWGTKRGLGHENADNAAPRPGRESGARGARGARRNHLPCCAHVRAWARNRCRNPDALVMHCDGLWRTVMVMTFRVSNDIPVPPMRRGKGYK